ncbi:MAG: uroporphyrinogen decarboxylase [Saprospiraceae bacterium]|nr:uroporphyrinogen decarboxylase [Saprospiraceae bacterium]
MHPLKNDLLIRTLNGEQTERPPVWLMRQAGRILPEYRAIRAAVSGFKELVTSPKLAAEVTTQPIDILKVDAAIIFSDILVIPECMGLPYELVEKVGPRFPRVIENARDINNMRSGDSAASELSYVYDAVRLAKKRLAGRVPLIGFAGAPWTLLAYMVEGGGSKTFSRAKAFLYAQPRLAHLLLDKITETIISYLQQKVIAGVDVLQVFDSWAGILNRDLYETFGLPYLEKICRSVNKVPLIAFAKGAWFSHQAISQLHCEAIGLDWSAPPSWARGVFGEQRVLQGNLDPCALLADDRRIVLETEHMLREFGPHHIANLGHGVYPDTSVESVHTFVNTVQNFRY